MELPLAEVCARLVALGLWERVMPYHWAVKPRGTALPYFCAIRRGERPSVAFRFMLLEGWQTFRDYIHTCARNDYAFYSTPMELPHFELVVFSDGKAAKVFRHDPGYVPVSLTAEQEKTCARMLWEVYGVMMRIESDPQLPLSFSDSQAVFARVEGADGVWRDAPLAIPAERQYVERISFAKADIAKAKDLKFDATFKLELDFGLKPDMMTTEARPRCAYLLAAADAESGEKVIWECVSVSRETGLKGLWEGLAAHFLKRILALGRVPGEVRVKSPRVFRMLRPLCIELPFKLSLHDSLPALAKILV